MKNKILLSAAILAATSSTIFAATGTFTVEVIAFQEPAIDDTTGVNFGKINPKAGSVCTMDKAGAVVGACLPEGNSAGLITISGLSANTTMNFTITADDTDADVLSYVPSADIDGVTYANGSSANFSVDGSGSDVTAAVFGVLTVGSTGLASGATVTTGYTVDVTFD
jgi:hypothetical protein